MAQVLEFDPAAGAAPVETLPHRRIRRASRALSALFGVILLLDIALAVIAGAGFLVDIPGLHVLIGPKGMLLTFMVAPPPGHPPLASLAPPPGYLPAISLPLVQRLAHLAMGLVVFPPGLMIFWNLRQLFRLYGQGVVFSQANARRIKAVGLWLAANAVAPLISVSVLSALHMVVDHNWFHPDTIAQLVLGGVVYVIAQVMEVGHQIEEERGQYV